ncbi:NAD(P)/FAD-dependent oxidoreductase [Novosphingobium sp. Fuku2-ISO-50]|uniref:NAD(P)/FAD-dependent oxidoreductase n=1 Tax=Novosphingobium sp. Fuku2-ISO-50 TaxID=1739114 RepID=UPI00076CEA85|nr:FAD-dependent oxidoreductase [Novosphingobium sp. Fuku2-ISO-50]KUR76712.1 pyridine nucleotide-disulfide oxidoreductase [Novosphingobium sp. Fuku2-ISO-50]
MGTSAPPSIVVVGSGLAGFGVLRELRKVSPEARLTLVTLEDGHFYSKPALSTALAKGKTAQTLITSTAEKMASQLRLDARIGRAAEAIDRAGKALLTTGGPVAYDALVLATGAMPVRPQIEGDAAHRAIAVNQLDHYARFRDELPVGARVLIMGSGLVGTEFANDLIQTGYRPVVVDMLPLPLAQLVPPAVGEKVRDALAAEGVEWHLGRKVVAIDYKAPAPGYVATLDNGTIVEADLVLSAVGLRPNVALAAEAGLDVGLGIKVDAHGRTSDPHIYAIGDCAEYPHGLSAYVTPIMAAARAIAPSALGTPTEIRFPPLSVQVKTTLLPINLLPPPRDAVGEWRCIEDDAQGSKHVFTDAEGRLRGYVLTHDKCEQRTTMDAQMGAKSGETV